MVKYGRTPVESPGKRISQLAWGSQDGGGHEAEEQGPSFAHPDGDDWPPLSDSQVGQLPPRTKGQKKGSHRAVLQPQAEGDEVPDTGGGSPP